MMPWFRHTIFLLFSVTLMLDAKASNEPIKITIGIQSYLHKSTAYQNWKKTSDHLTRRMPGFVFNIVVIDTPDDALLHQMVKDKKVDYVITQPITTIELVRLYNTHIELTKNDATNVNQLGSVIFTSSGNRSIQTVESLKGNSFAASTPERLGGWVLALDHLTTQGVNPYQDFSRIEFLGAQDNIVNAVVSGLIDAGTVRTGVIETMIDLGQINRDQIKILNSRKDFPYFLSTYLVPEWAFSSLQHSDPQLTQGIREHLLGYKHGDQVNQWVEPLDYSSVRELLRKHRIGSYKDPGYIKYYRENFVIIIVSMLLAGYLLQVYHNRKKIEIQQYKMKLEQLSRVSSVDQLLAEVTHELAQPITSIKIDAHILTKLLKDSANFDYDQIKTTSSELQLKTDHCVELLANIRNFLSTKNIVKERFAINKSVLKITKMLDKELNDSNIKLKLSLLDNPGFVKMSPIELEQVLLNLIKNSMCAMTNNLKQTNTLSITSVIKQDTVVISIRDTGSKVKDVNNLFVLFKSNKERASNEGLGVGLNLSRRIIRSYGGDLVLNSSSEEGTEFLIILRKVG
jgi:two-component system, LuxR family, sensor histidine kinase TtrS